MQHQFFISIWRLKISSWSFNRKKKTHNQPNPLTHKQCASFFLYNLFACCVFTLLIFAFHSLPPHFLSFLTPMYCIYSLLFFMVILTILLWKFTHTVYPLFYLHVKISLFPILSLLLTEIRCCFFFPLFTLYSKVPFAVLSSTFLPSDTEQHLGISWELQYSYLMVQQQASFWTYGLVSVIHH